MISAARSNIGVPYRYGGSSPQTGFDCSGLVCWSFEQVGITLPRRASEQLRAGHKVESKEDLQPGDIVVFKGTRSRSGWHSGIYTGDGYFVHSPSTGKTVTESRLDETYYARRFAGARRIAHDGNADKALVASAKAREQAGASSPENTALASSQKPAKKTPRAHVADGAGKAPAKKGKASDAAVAKKAPAKATAKAKAPATAKAQATAKAPAKAEKPITVASVAPKGKAVVKPRSSTPLRSAAVERGGNVQKKADGVVNKLQAEAKKTSASASHNLAKGK